LRPPTFLDFRELWLDRTRFRDRPGGIPMRFGAAESRPENARSALAIHPGLQRLLACAF
jgi:hypothetical protein